MSVFLVSEKEHCYQLYWPTWESIQKACTCLMGKDISKVTFPISDIHLHFLPCFFWGVGGSIGHFNSHFAWENHLVWFKCELSPASVKFWAYSHTGDKLWRGYRAATRWGLAGGNVLLGRATKSYPHSAFSPVLFPD